jgi:hypothetical protein
MKRNRRSLAPALIPAVIPLAVVAALPALAHAAATPLAVECTNLTLGECSAVEALFADAYALASGQPVARQAVPAGPSGEPAPAAPMVGEHVRVSAVRLSTRIALRAQQVRSDGTAAHAVEMTATGLDDVQPAANRMSQALVKRTSIEQTMTIKNVTQSEGRAHNRTFTEKVMGFKTSLTTPFTSDLELAPMLALQFDGRFETDSYFLEFGAGATIPTDSNDRRGYGGLFAEFGGSAYLGPEGTPLYLGAGIIPRLFFSSDAGGVAAAVYGQVGLMFMRTSSTRLYIELRVAQNAMPIKFKTSTKLPVAPTNSSGSVYTSEISKYPTELALQVGIGW